MLKYIYLSVTIILSFLSGYYVGNEKNSGTEAEMIAISDCENKLEKLSNVEKKEEIKKSFSKKETMSSRSTEQNNTRIASETKTNLEKRVQNNGGVNAEEEFPEEEENIMVGAQILPPGVPDVPLTNEQLIQKEIIAATLREQEMSEEDVQLLSTDMVLSGEYDTGDGQTVTPEEMREQLLADMREQGESDEEIEIMAASFSSEGNSLQEEGVAQASSVNDEYDTADDTDDNDSLQE